MPLSDVDLKKVAPDANGAPDSLNADRETQSLTMQPDEGKGKKGLILLVEDDRGDQLLTREALGESAAAKNLVVVSDGEEALNYLQRTGKYEDPSQAPRPDLILLDLNMPKVNGRQVAAQAKEDPQLRSIPIVVLSTSDYPEDISYCYEVGVNSYVHKPTEFEDFVNAISAIEHYWLDVVEPPYSH